MASFYYRAGRADSDAIPFLEKVREGEGKRREGREELITVKIFGGISEFVL